MFATDFNGPNEGPATLTGGPSTWRTARSASPGWTTTPRSSPGGRAAGRAAAPVRLRHADGGRHAAGTGADAGDALLKHDLVAGTSTPINLGAGRKAASSSSYPRARRGEDDGVLMGLVYDTDTDRSEPGHHRRAELENGRPCTCRPGANGFHGNWRPPRADRPGSWSGAFGPDPGARRSGRGVGSGSCRASSQASAAARSGSVQCCRWPVASSRAPGEHAPRAHASPR